ncbi:MAG TPA: VOC family protein [Planctomycetota bacterium]|nr:VOC family protein [Planctomycetota bacterium]
MIRGIHGLFYSSDPVATRAFFRDKVKLPGSDIGQGWWIFDVPEGDLGVHPAEHGGKPGDHDVSFYCDDIEGTVRDLKSRGVRFTQPVADHGYGLVTFFVAPGGITVQLYEPRYKKQSASSKPVAKKKVKPVARAKSSGKKAAKKRA